MKVIRVLSASALLTLVGLAPTVGAAQQPSPAIDTSTLGKQGGANKGPLELSAMQRAIQARRNGQIGTP